MAVNLDKPHLWKTDTQASVGFGNIGCKTLSSWESRTMKAIYEAELTRLDEQQRLDQLRTAKERNEWGQFATPPALSLDIARYVWNTLSRRKGKFSFLEPAFGTGSFYSAFLQVFPHDRIGSATGVELDERFAAAAEALWEGLGLHLVQADFTR